MRKVKLICFLLLSAFLFGSCSSMMYPEKENPEDCLLIIPTEFIQGANTDKARTYYVDFTNQKSDSAVPGNRYGSIKLVQEKGGNKIQAITSRVTNANYSGDPTRHEYDIPLPYIAGQVIISDFKIVHTIERTKSRETISGYDFVTLTDKEKQEYLYKLKEDGVLDSWF